MADILRQVQEANKNMNSRVSVRFKPSKVQRELVTRCWLFVVFLWSAIPATASIDCRNAAGQLRDCAVLLVHSYHPNLEWVQILSESFSAELNNADHIRIDTEFLDAKRRPALEHADTFLSLLREKYEPHRPDVVVISDDPAFDLLWPIHNELWPDVPIVFMGLNTERKELLVDRHQITGVYELHTTDETVELALELTGASGIIVLNDTSETGLANEVMLSELVALYPDIDWVIQRDLSVGSIGRLDSLPDDWPIITMLPLREGGRDGPMLSQRRSVEFLRRSLPNPLFYDSQWMMGSGLVGGYSFSGGDHARQAGELVLQILGGASPGDLPLRTVVQHDWIFDQRELDRFGWTPDLLPENAIIQFASEGFWDRHSEVIVPFLAALATTVLIIAFLMLTVNRQRRAEAQLRAQKQRLSAALAAADAGVFEIRRHSRYASPRWLELIGQQECDPTLAIDESWMKSASEKTKQHFYQALERLANETQRERVELIIEGSRPRILDVLMTSRCRQSGQNGPIVGVATDITVTRHLEEEADRRNRLELLGELAGGVAHDFNNFLLVVKFSAEMAKNLDDPIALRKLMTEVEEAGLRATDIVKQLLSFGRRDPKSAKVTDLNETVKEVCPFLRRMVGLDCEIVVSPYTEPLGVRIDRPQFERVLSNLVVNARDAMSRGGTIKLSVGVDVIDDIESVIVQVQDEGEGMDASTRIRMFEPFYSTKSADKGTGLGLSTVYGIVKGSGGKITVESAPGEGARFSIWWPREPVAMISTAETVVKPKQDSERSILLVEDDPLVGPITQKILEKYGSKATLAKDGQEGLDLFSKRPDEFDLVLSDVVLPKMNGIDMVAQIRRMRPSVPVGFMSGCTNHPSLDGALLPKDIALLEKPFSRDELRSFVDRRLLDHSESVQESSMELA